MVCVISGLASLEMDSPLQPDTQADLPHVDSAERDGDSGFTISPTPIVAGEEVSAADASADLPAAEGNEPLYLLPRDPNSAFAFWNLDWTIAFGEPAPREREVLLKVSKLGDGETKVLAISPTAGSCLVDDLEAESAYQASLGYHDLAGEWVLLATSAEVTTPAAQVAEPADADFATVPFHLSFHRMLELLRVPKQESQSLTTMLNELRTRAEAATAGEVRSRPDDQELVHAIRQAVIQDPPPTGAASVAELWTTDLMQQVLGSFKGSASPPNGFGESSRAA